MSSTPPDPSIPPGYRPGDYIPYADRDPRNPSPVAGQPERPTGPTPGVPEDPYRAIYGYDAPDRIRLAGWGRRVLAYVFDTFLSVVAGIPFVIGYVQFLSTYETRTGVTGEETLVKVGELPASAAPLMVLGGLLYVAFYIYNWCIRQGRTGYTFGKSVVGIKLVGERTGRPIGGGMSFVRQIAHIVDSLVCNPRLPVAHLGPQEADLRRQDHEHARGGPAPGPAAGPGRLPPPGLGRRTGRSRLVPCRRS